MKKQILEEAEKGKFQKNVQRYGELIRSELVPFAMEASGRLGEAAMKFLDDLSKNLADNDEKKAEKKARSLLARRIAATLVIYNGSLMASFRRRSDEVPIHDNNYGDPFVDIPDDPETRDY